MMNVLKYKSNKPDSHCVDKINCLYESSNGTIWLGSNGYGLYKLLSRDNENYQFQSFTTAQGLANNCVLGILEDQRGRLWLSTCNGVSCYNPSTNKFINYTKEDGLISNQFYWNAYCKSRINQNLYFGNMGGLIAIEGNKIQPKPLNEKERNALFSLNRLGLRCWHPESLSTGSWTRHQPWLLPLRHS